MLVRLQRFLMQPMQYRFKIFSPNESPSSESLDRNSKHSPDLFEAYSCVLFETLRRVEVRAVPLKSLRSGFALCFATELPWQVVQARLRHVMAQWNARTRGLALAARVDDRALAPA